RSYRRTSLGGGGRDDEDMAILAFAFTPARQPRHLGDRHVDDATIMRGHRLELDDLLGLQCLLAHLLGERAQALDLLVAEAAGVDHERLRALANSIAIDDLVDE